MAYFGQRALIMQEVNSNLSGDTDYGLYDTLVVSYSRYPEFKRLMHEKPRDERANIIASLAVGHSTVYYCDEYGTVSKYFIEGD